MMRKCFILSIDGGGIRGMIPSVFLASLADNLERRGVKKPLHNIFDIMAGTSTGGLIAMALSVPLFGDKHGNIYDKDGGVMPQYLPCLYETLGEKIFPGNRYKVRKVVRQLFTSKYSSEPMRQVLKGVYRECPVKDALTNLLITSFDMKTMHPIFIKKRPVPPGSDTDMNFYMVDTALAAAAVPTYFPPVNMKSIGSDGKAFCLIDGGIFCINPAMSAYIEARKIFPHADYVILSLGTGIQTEQYKTETMHRWGFFNWIAPWLNVPLITAVGDGQRISTNHMLQKLSRVSLYRFDIHLESGKGSMDDGSRENLQYLKEKAYKMLAINNDSFNRLVDEIIEHMETSPNKKSVTGPP